MRRLSVPILLALATCGPLLPVKAAIVAVTPATFAAAIATAVPGETVQLAPGTYPPAYFRGRTVPRAGVTITALPGAVSGGMRFDGASGLAVIGLTFDGGNTAAIGLQFDGGDHLTASLNHFANFLRAAIAFGPETSDSAAHGNVIVRSGSDGIDVALSRRIVIDGNSCSDFVPTPDAHPDCIQLWSGPAAPPTADITIANNYALGVMQFVSLFNHVRGGVDDGGFDRIAITANIGIIAMSDGIDVYACRLCTVARNTLVTVPGAAHQAHLFVSSDSTAAVSANDIGALPQ